MFKPVQAFGEKSSALSRRWHLLARLAWGALFVVHLAPLAAITNQIASSPSTKLALSLAAVLGISAIALLKAIDVPWLRIHLNGRGWCALILIGLLFHGEAIANKMPDAVIETSVMVTTLMALLVLECLVLSNRSSALRHVALSYWIEEVALSKWLNSHLILPSPRGPPVR